MEFLTQNFLLQYHALHHRGLFCERPISNTREANICKQCTLTDRKLLAGNYGMFLSPMMLEKVSGQIGSAAMSSAERI